MESEAPQRDRVPAPPIAAVRPTELTAHGQVRVDDYYWLRERDNPEVMAYLEAENEYTQAVMAPTEALQEGLFQEIKGRIKQTDSTAPAREGDYLYYTRYEDGKEYPIHCRRRGSMDRAEEVILDVNILAEGYGFCQVGSWKVSPGQNILAYAVDTQGRRIFTMRFRDLDTGQDLEDAIAEVTPNLAWAEDNQTLFYTRQDPVTLRWCRVHRHGLGDDPTQDELVYEEQDDTYSCHVRKTRSRKYILLGSSQTLSTEYRYLRADDPRGEFALFEPRQRDHEYHVDHAGDHFYIRTNLAARNFRLMKAPVGSTDQHHWQEVIGHRGDVLLSDFDVFSDHLVVSERSEGLIQIRIIPSTGTGEHYLDFGEPAYDAYVGANAVFDTQLLRYVYSSMTTPMSDYDYDMDTRDKELVKQEEVQGDFDPARYETQRVWAPAADGERIPISIVHRRGLQRDGSNPLLLYAYGSYGASTDASFRPDRLSLLDRGFAYAIAHVRGGQELGRHWYEDGKLLKKKNTFTDFIACAEYLVGKGYTQQDRLFALGGSAGGLLMGAVYNMRPELFHGLVGAVPWVDVVTTMLDDSIPLTTSEYDEWGNPNEREYYDYMLSYSPYDNVAAKDGPHLLVLAGLHDSQVQYCEPAKWVAKLRARKTDSNRLLLKTEMQAGHGGPSGRYRQYRETALIYAFMLDLVGPAN